MENITKRFVKITSLSFLLGIFVITNAGFSTDLTGEQIAVKAKYGNRAQTSISQATMVLQSQSGNQWKTVDTRNIIMQSMIWAGSGNNSLIRSISRFTSGLKRGVTFLSIESVQGQDDIQYIYLPALRRPRRVSSAEKQNDFEDTDFTNEDMGAPKIENYNRLPDESYRGMDCYVLERTPKDRSTVKYSKHVTWITKQHFLPIKVEAYDLNNRLVKKIYARDIKKFGNIWIPMQLSVTNIQKNTRTGLVITKFLVDRQANINRNDLQPDRMDATWSVR
jgi:hypothetical protein